jgi:hypothetical protein
MRRAVDFSGGAAGRPVAQTLLLAIGLALVAFAGPGCARHEIRKAEARLETLRNEKAALHDRLELLIDRDTYLASALAESAEVVLALPEDIIHDLFHEITRNYFDRVELNLTPEDLEVNEDGDLRVKTFLGRMTAGSWKLHLDIHKLRGVLSAGAPHVTVSGTNRLHMVIPAQLQRGSGSATLKFDWDPKGLANIVCDKYSTTQPLSGEVIPRDYLLKGDFILTAGEDNLMADPEFPPDKFVISVEPSKETWAEVREKLESQDKLFKCGLVFNPDDVVDKLKALGRRGFKVKLPRTLFRAVKLPASISKSVDVGSSNVQLSVRPNVLRVTPTTFWYSASVEATTTAKPSPEGPAGADSLLTPDSSEAETAGPTVAAVKPARGEP